MSQLTVALVAVPRVIGLDFSIPAHLLGGHPGYRVLVCGDERGTGPGIVPDRPLASIAEADIVILPGYDEPEAPLPADYLAPVREAADLGARLVAICTGAFALAQAGILDEREATTHWRFVRSLREHYPRVRVLENRLFVEDGKILTSAGAGAGIDACLHLIRTDFGEAAAYEAGKEIVAAPARDGIQPQYVDVLAAPRASLADTRSWLMEHLGDPITVQRMAEHANLSRRTFIRRFERETGMSPMRWVVNHRVLSARRLLETSDWAVERIAAATGFGTAANFRSVFRREVGATPTEYRRTYRTDRSAASPASSA
ncbi:GlxA family transcriptional regulator [Amycolatopsis sp. WGS_07]|uniref:GlxA family transcriptional regulator n=1 Tax=Amycolatopsis sp. WGS_07 TaxID=3076764 RepID=UPI003873C174